MTLRGIQRQGAVKHVNRLFVTFQSLLHAGILRVTGCVFGAAIPDLA